MNAANAPGTQGTAPLSFDPIDVNQLQKDAINASTIGYDLSDSDLASRLPGLVTANKARIEDATRQLTGPLDPTVQNAFARNALESSLAVTGSGNPNAGVGGIGSLSGNTAAASIANQVQQKQDYDRSYFDQVLADNPERAFGLSGSDAANVGIANTQAQNAYNQQKYQMKVAQENAGGGGF